MGRRTGASRSELLQAIDAGFTPRGEDWQQQREDGEEEDGEEEHWRQAGREECDVEPAEGPAAATRGQLGSAPRHDAGHGAQLAKPTAHTAEPGDGEGGAAASSVRGVSDMMPVVYDCGACGKEEEWHTWFDGWEGPCYEGKCERCYSSSAAVSKQQKSEAARDNGGWETQLVKLKKYMRRHSNCNVPQRWAEDRTLGSWVNSQREYKKKLDRGEPSHGMTVARAAKLEALGFVWERGHVMAPTTLEVAEEEEDEEEGEEGEEIEVQVEVEEDDDGYAEVLEWQPRVSARVRTKPARPGMVDPTQPGASSVEWRDAARVHGRAA